MRSGRVVCSGSNRHGSAGEMLASKRTPIWPRDRARARASALHRRAAEAGHLAEHAVERHAAKARPSIASPNSAARQPTVRFLLGERAHWLIVILAMVIANIRTTKTPSSSAMHVARARAGACGSLRPRAAASCRSPSGRRPAPRTAEQIEDREGEQPLFRAPSPSARSRGWRSTAKREQQEDGAERDRGGAVDQPVRPSAQGATAAATIGSV